ncbi:speckle-type POZ protein B-like [Leptopilina heterotoma]|uniref:speckle-type POZ protein B-like n=1 Tax=Leptopilina heterotoma TaxID=63436 RepID=UPI001CA7B81B|nr:speckle-type POZ protein B-like [Leptopilina heterotoma]
MAVPSKKAKLWGGDDNIQDYASKLKLLRNNFTWTIENFEYICQNMKVIRSPRFVSKHSKDEYFIEIQPTELREGNEDLLNIRFICTDDITKFIYFKLRVVRYINYQYDYIRTFYKEQKEQNNWEISGSDLCKAFGNTIPQNVLIKCEFSVIDTTNTIKKSITDFQKCDGLMENIKSLLKNEDFKDIKIKIEDKEFTAHKNILAIRSPVFAAMFKNKMNEELTSIVQIDDIKPTLFQQMLKFIYTDQVENLKETAFELLYAAEKYQLDNLKCMCIKSLNDNLSINSVFKTLEVAELYSIESLKNECLKFMYEEKFDIYKTNDFQELIKIRPNLWIDILKMEKLPNTENGNVDCFNNWVYELKSETEAEPKEN